MSPKTSNYALRLINNIIIIVLNKRIIGNTNTRVRIIPRRRRNHYLENKSLLRSLQFGRILYSIF